MCQLLPSIPPLRQKPKTSETMLFCSVVVLFTNLVDKNKRNILLYLRMYYL